MHFVSLCTLQATAGRGKELCSRPGWHCPSTVSPSDWCIWTSSWRCWFPPTALWRWPVPEWRAGCTTSSSVRSRWPGGITNYKDGRTGAMRRGWQWAGLKIRNQFSPVRPAAESCASCSICEAASLGYSSLTCLRGGEEVQSVSEVFSLCRFLSRGWRQLYLISWTRWTCRWTAGTCWSIPGRSAGSVSWSRCCSWGRRRSSPTDCSKTGPDCLFTHKNTLKHERRRAETCTCELRLHSLSIQFHVVRFLHDF